MICKVTNKITVLCIVVCVNYIYCHLKDMGEIETNFTNIDLTEITMKILGGTNASISQFPFNVQVLNHGSLCGGSILTLKAVLTAAHCFEHNKNIAEMVVLSRPRFLFDPRADHHEVWDYVLHEHYKEGAFFANDIAILLIHDQFTLGEQVQKVMLSVSEEWMRTNETFLASGWGESKFGGGLQETNLKQVNLSFVTRESCKVINNVELSPDMFCLFGDGKRDTCRGDSGGGIVWNGLLVGITSHGRGCGQRPGMYVNVNYFREWIETTVRALSDRFCVFHGPLLANNSNSHSKSLI